MHRISRSSQDAQPRTTARTPIQCIKWNRASERTASAANAAGLTPLALVRRQRRKTSVGLTWSPAPVCGGHTGQTTRPGQARHACRLFWAGPGCEITGVVYIYYVTRTWKSGPAPQALRFSCWQPSTDLENRGDGREMGSERGRTFQTSGPLTAIEAP